MRVFALSVFALATCATVTGSSQAPASRPEGDAAAIITAARDALGGDKRLSAVRTFVVEGRTRQVQGDNLVPIEFEISCELPDKCVRRDEVPARESGLTTSGFNGADLIQLPAAPSGGGGPPPAAAAGRGTPPAPPGASRVNTSRVDAAKQEFARWWLGMFASSFSSYPLTFTRVGQAEAPQGQADVVEAKSPDGFTARLFILKDSHLPIMLSWQGQAQGKPMEQRLYYADYRDVDGFKLPFRLRRAAGADTTEETNIDRFRVNVRIDPKKFEVRR